MKQIPFKIITCLFLLCFALITYTQTIFIVIHGTWAAKEEWYMPGGDFFDALEKGALQQQAAVIPYRWSGNNNYKDRIQAAKGLVRLIQNYSRDTTICLVSHSHGGNVGIIASQLLGAMANTTNHIHIFYALGTPVNRTDYLPNMNIIDYFYNLFSFEDLIQPVLGMFEREYLQHERIANIRITINNKEPGHTQLHSPLTGQLLPTLHEFLTTVFQDFDFKEPGIIDFTENQKPIYALDRERKKYIERDRLLNKMILSTLFRNPQHFTPVSWNSNQYGWKGAHHTNFF